MSTETCHLAFTIPPGSVLAGVPVGDIKLPTPYVSYGLPFTESCAHHIKHTFDCKRVFIIASRTLSRETDELEKLIEKIGSDHVAHVHKGITPHTPWSEVLEIAAEARNVKADCVVTLGAGSISDGAKLVVLALANGIETLEEFAKYSLGSKEAPSSVKEPTTPLIMIPTTLSGGEYSNFAGGTNDQTNHKQGFLHSGMGSNLVILDPTLSKTTPQYHWLSTGFRSVDHCVEAFCAVESTPESDEHAESGLRKLIPNLLRTKQDPDDLEARLQCQLGVIDAMNNVRAGIPMGGSHAIGHQLGPLGVPHGVTSCIMCPEVMKFNWKHGQSNEKIRQKQNKLKEILWSDGYVDKVLQGAGKDKATSDLGDLLDAIVRELGLPRKLTEMKISREVLPTLAERALSDFWAATNPVPLAKSEQILEILQSAY
ncbi:Dehydroquinate synthase-like protein [Penicillium chermesinum]|uniref:Dehydroquinate synthase-like protein n=1 Tax=Penicillium chermesinum TaxID=63820 RepID=A0A9W9TQ44_9EURO|nr:Dehydroquinate synthase-like protein [Penicillium chermesinum]KAJ5232914.1 Dehydroquinate synthase-like protein [Penicillium chermesinum]